MEEGTISPLLPPQRREHLSQRAPWLRALVLGANDGLVSIASLMLGISAVKYDAKTAILSGIAGLVAGACSMAIGEFVSVFSQRDTELADIQIEAEEHRDGPDAEARELQELTLIYVQRGLSYGLARQVAEELSKGDVIRVHARDELGIDLDSLANPAQAAGVSALSFSVGGLIPLLGSAFFAANRIRIIALVFSSTLGLASFGAVGALLGGASLWRGSFRVTVGGWIAMLLTYGILRLTNLVGSSFLAIMIFYGFGLPFEEQKPFPKIERVVYAG